MRRCPILPAAALGLCWVGLGSAGLGPAGLFSGPALAQSHQHDGPYAGLESRSIKSLSEGDIEQILAGQGWGLALPAELNGWPGPVHLLELKDELALSPEQIAAIQTMVAEMRRDAIDAGERFLSAEAALGRAFEGEALSEAELKALVDEAAAARSALRLVHLARHLATPNVLTEAQIERYSVLRGYASDPCAAVPDGHNAEMWRRHNNCG